MNIFYSKRIDNNTIFLEAEEFTHCIKSLRKKEGDTVWVADGKGNRYKCVITMISKREAELQIVDTKSRLLPSYGLTVAIAPTKNNTRIEWFVEKSVEIGIQRICPFVSSNSERRRLRIDRLEKIALSAMKQSGAYFLPEITELVDFKNLIKDRPEQQKYLAHYNPEKRDLFTALKLEEDAFILIGPEGDFTKEEIELAIDCHFENVILSHNRLRTETAALVACQIFNLKNLIH